jgi:hypothetical protein
MGMKLHEKIQKEKRGRWGVIAAWVWCVFTGVLVIGAIGTAASGDFDGTADAIMANVFFGLVFAGALVLLIFVRKRHHRS